MQPPSPFPHLQELPPSGTGRRTESSDGISRRIFARGLAGIVAAPIAAAPLAAERLASAGDVGEKPDDMSALEWGEVQARYGNLLRVYAGRVTAEQRHTLLNVLIGNERMLSSIRKFAVQNSDPAALTLRVMSQGSSPNARTE